MLPPLASKLGNPDGVGRIDAPWAASYALFPEDWSSFAAASGGRFLVAMPARDVLLYVKGDDEAAQRLLAAATLDAAEHSPNGISTDVYHWNGSGFTLGTETSTMNHGAPIVRNDMPYVAPDSPSAGP